MVTTNEGMAKLQEDIEDETSKQWARRVAKLCEHIEQMSEEMPFDEMISEIIEMAKQPR